MEKRPPIEWLRHGAETTPCIVQGLVQKTLPSLQKTHPSLQKTHPPLQKTLRSGICIQYTFGVWWWERYLLEGSVLIWLVLFLARVIYRIIRKPPGLSHSGASHWRISERAIPIFNAETSQPGQKSSRRQICFPFTYTVVTPVRCFALSARPQEINRNFDKTALCV